MFLKIDYDEPESTLNPTEGILYSFVKSWCSNHKGQCTLAYKEIREHLPYRNISLVTVQKTIPKLVNRGLLIRKGTKSSPILEVFSNSQKDDYNKDSNSQKDDLKSSNRQFEIVKNTISTICKDHKLDQGKDHPLSSSSDSTPSAEDIKAAEEAMKRHGL